MKNILYTAILMMGFGVATLQAQDISFTNTSLVPPANGAEYGKACFTIIAEEGVDVSTIPFAVEVSLSKVDFDVDGIFGFNSESFDWETDGFAQNVIRGTLITAIQDVDNGGGGAQVCIPVRRDNAEDYNETRNGFVVNLIPGNLNVNGNNGEEYIEKFGFSGSSQNSLLAQNEGSSNMETRFDALEDVEINVYPNPTAEYVNIDVKNGNGSNNIRIYNSIGQTFFQNKSDDTASINTSEWTEGIYFVEVKDEQETVLTIEKLVISQ